jgi:hypothetical protein
LPWSAHFIKATRLLNKRSRVFFGGATSSPAEKTRAQDARKLLTKFFRALTHTHNKQLIEMSSHNDGNQISTNPQLRLKGGIVHAR